MSLPYLGEIRMFGGNFAPAGYVFCDGSLLAISENDALFALIGTTYGGDGVTTFGVPDLRGRVPIHIGQGAGLPSFVLGQSGGTESVTLTTTNLPAHNHPAASGGPATTASPAGNLPGTTTGGNEMYAAPGGPVVAMAAGTLAPAGGSQPHDNMGPFLTVNFIMAVQGVFPSQN